MQETSELILNHYPLCPFNKRVFILPMFWSKFYQTVKYGDDILGTSDSLFGRKEAELAELIQKEFSFVPTPNTIYVLG